MQFLDAARDFVPGLRVLDQKVRQLRRMRHEVARMLVALQKAAGMPALS
jgi:hypothetical protein